MMKNKETDVPTLVVPPSLEYDACKITDKEIPKKAYENKINSLQNQLKKIKNSRWYKIGKYFNLI